MDLIKKLYFYSFSFCLHIVAQTLGKLRFPWTKKKTDYADVERIMGHIQDGDIILVRTLGEITTFIIPGYYKHCAIYLGDGRIVHSTGKGVHIDWLANLIMKTDYYVVKRIDNENDKRKRVGGYACGYVGLPYDTYQNFKNSKAFSCSELVRTATNDAFGTNFLMLKKRLGFDTLTPQDIDDDIRYKTVIGNV